MRGRGEPSRRPKGILIVDAHTTQYGHSNQETHTEDQGCRRAGPPELVGDIQESGNITQAAKKLGMSQPRGSKWWARYKKYGFDGLEDRPRSGRPSKVAGDKIGGAVTQSPIRRRTASLII